MSGVTVLGWCSNSPSNPYLVEAWFVRARWLRGACPCCGLPLSPLPGLVIGEGVTLCRWCSRPDHAPGDRGRVRLLRALASAPPHCP